MAALDKLDPDEQKAVIEFSTMVRGGVGELARVLNRLSRLNDAYVNTVSPIFEKILGIDKAATIADNTGLAVTMPLSANDLVTLVSHIQAALVLNDADHIGMWVKAAGPSNIVG